MSIGLDLPEPKRKTEEVDKERVFLVVFLCSNCLKPDCVQGSRDVPERVYCLWRM